MSTGGSGYDRRSRSVAGALSAAFERLRRRPELFVPFALAGVVLAGIDALRRRDPIPAREHDGLDEGTVHLEYVGYPTATSRTALPFESLVGLEPSYLAWALGLYVLSVLVVALAGVLTLTVLLTGGARLGPLPSYLGVVVGFDLAFRVLGSNDFLRDTGLVGLGVLAVVLSVLVWLFAVPGLVAAGASLRSAIRRSGGWIRGDRWTALGLILALGIGAWLLGSVPVFGTVLTGVVVAPVHAVVIASVIEYGSTHGQFDLPA